MNKEIAEVINMINDFNNFDIDEFSDKIAKRGNLKETLLINVNSGYRSCYAGYLLTGPYR